MTEQAADARPARRRLGILFGVWAVALAADFTTKEIALANYSWNDPVELLGGLLNLTLTFNSGAAFSFGTGYPWVFTLIAMTVTAVVVYYAPKVYSTGWAVTLGLILGGATGNLVDRLFRAPGFFQGHVVDWIQVNLFDFPVFNIADSSIFCGAALALVLTFRGHNLNGTRGDRPEGEDEDAGGPGGEGSAEGGGTGASARTDAEAAAPAPRTEPVPGDAEPGAGSAESPGSPGSKER
ncbi:signal peptidase II [Allonocardiopsis opalescens]|uniref:Lipoprotein signal peptidase n=1 Tax=Allonocardiopsis opalescens TaxID=1144618 RepID=A0A2T0Q3W7_9ACTN|nr:signal peptidase II [Allonocardiopsis opalescens]PRX98500.1 signal peptidase II [Allonocardiopsis opalescens]